MAFAPDGRLFICIQTGELRVVKNGTLLGTPFVTLSVNSSGERGLLGVAFDPSFATNHFVYVYYTTSSAPVHNRVTRFVANGDVADASSETSILELENLSSATNHNGGAIHFGPDGKLYVAVGENANGANAQTLGNRLGKILRINADGSIPEDNPFYGTATGVNRSIWALGLRNPFTFGFQPGTTRMFINDVGQSTWEEINDGIAGSNYGWPTTEGPTSDTRFRAPLFAYGHGSTATTGTAIVGAAFYNPPRYQFPASYVGKYFFADLGSGWIRVLNPADNTASGFATGIAVPVDIQVGPDGALYYLARGGGGELWRVEATASQPLNLSTRGRVSSGDNVMIGGFIVTGNVPKKLILRAIGPSLPPSKVANPLADPILELHGAGGALLTSNDNWKDSQQQQIQETQLAPTNDLESAIVATLQPGSYTAIIRSQPGANGVGLVEAYDLDPGADSRLANVSTRALVQSDTDVLIGGFILGRADGAARLVLRAMGPSLRLDGALQDPVIQLRDNNGGVIATNDNWQDDSAMAAEISAVGLAPGNPSEAALSTSLLPGPYTAIVTGKNGASGIGLVELFNLP